MIIFELNLPFHKAFTRDNYNCGFLLNWYDKINVESARKILENLVSDKELNPVRSSLNIEKQIIEQSIKYERAKIFEYNSSGIFEIFWVINTKIMDFSLEVDYNVLLKRPSNSLAYSLFEKKRMDFTIENWIREYKMRKRIDGLPVYFKVEDWGIYTGFKKCPKKLTINAKYFKPVPFVFENENSISLSHISKFEGNWEEEVRLYDDYKENKSISLEVRLNGQWVR